MTKNTCNRAQARGHSQPIWRSALGVILFSMVVASCAINTPRPSGTAQVIAVHQPVGPPPPLARALAQSVVTELEHRGYIAGLAGTLKAQLDLTGKAETLDASHAPSVALISWTLLDGKQTEVAFLRQYINGSSDAWAYGSPAMIRVIGEKTANDLSPFLADPPRKRVGSAPRLPPVINEARSLEELFDLQPASQDTGSSAAQGKTINQSPSSATQASTQQPQAALPVVVTGGQNRPFGLWVDAVTGAPGDGNASLTGFMLEMLENAGVPFARTAGTASHYIQGVVDVEALDATLEHVTITWIILNSSGQELGRVNQSNDIVRGSLHQEWRDTARFAAQGGVEGIMAILERNMGAVQ